MPFKMIMSEHGKAWKVEGEAEALVGKNIGDMVDGKDILPTLEGYELKITGGSDQAGFPLYKEVEGIGFKRVLLTKGWGMKDNREGVRLRKTVRGKQISAMTSQINMMVVNVGKKPLAEIFPEQNKPAEAKAEAVAAPAA